METTTFGEFIVDSIDGNQCTAHSAYDEGISGTFFLPPLSRTDTSQIASGSRFYGVFNTQSGMGALMVALGDADFKGHFDYDLTTSGSIKASGDIKATGDVKAGLISLNSHMHVCSVSGSTSGTPTMTPEPPEV